jgi:hypothetical protein
MHNIDKVRWWIFVLFLFLADHVYFVHVVTFAGDSDDGPIGLKHFSQINCDDSELMLLVLI